MGRRRNSYAYGHIVRVRGYYTHTHAHTQKKTFFADRTPAREHKKNTRIHSTIVCVER